MNKRVKQLMAVILVVCALLTMTVPMAFAAGETTITFNLYDDPAYESMFLDAGSKVQRNLANACKCGCGELVNTHLEENYSTIKWMGENTSENTLSYFNLQAGGLRLKSIPASGWGALRIHIPTGTYSISLPVTGNTATMKMYLFSADAETMSVDAITAEMTENNLMTVENADSGVVAKAAQNVTEGDYIVVIESTHPSKTRDYYLTTLTLTPVVENNVASVGGTNYTDAASAIDAIEKAGENDTVEITGNLQLTKKEMTTAAAIVVKSGAVLDLNGAKLSAKAVTCTGTGVVTDSKDGTGLINVTTGAVVNTDSTHLALYDSREGAKGYRVYKASVASYKPTFVNKTDATEGVKFWFTLNFTNKDAYGAIATGDSQLSIKGTWSVDARELEFPTDTVKAWADAQSKAQAGQTYALYVIVTGMDQVDSLTITPKVGALSATAIEYTKQ